MAVNEKEQQMRGFLWFSPEFLMRKTYLSKILRKTRRIYLSTFYPGYVKASIEASRGGDCNRCGTCCEFLYKCPFLGRDSQNLPYCRVYGDLRPAACNNYPFDRVDSEVGHCGFKFKD